MAPNDCSHSSGTSARAPFLTPAIAQTGLIATLMSNFIHITPSMLDDQTGFNPESEKYPKREEEFPEGPVSSVRPIVMEPLPDQFTTPSPSLQAE